jgi:hypothetical protein
VRRAILATALLVLLLPASASAQEPTPWEPYSELANRNLKPAPLVFVSGPKPLRQFARYLEVGGGPKRYMLRLSDGVKHTLALTGGEYKSSAAARRYFTQRNYTLTSTRVRGRRGTAFKHRDLGQGLIWSEGGRVYVIASGTFSIAALRKTANDLQRLGIARWGVSAPFITDDGGGNRDISVFAVTTEKTITGRIDFGAPCQYGGYQDFILQPLQGNSFTLPLAHEEWTGTMRGTIDATSITVTVHVTRPPYAGVSCDSGEQTFTLDQIQD